MMERIAEASPRFKAKIAGVFYLLTILTGGFALFDGGWLVVNGDAAATATNILGARAFISVGFRSRPHHDRVLYRCDGSLL